MSIGIISLSVLLMLRLNNTAKTIKLIMMGTFLCTVRAKKIKS